MKKVLIVAPYSSLPSDEFVNRFAHLATRLAERGHAVTLATGRFCHRTKTFHVSKEAHGVTNPQVVLVDNREYVSHIGLNRVLSLRDFRRNFEARFPTPSEFDVIYSAYPSIAHNISISRRIDRARSKFIIDVQDVWPESFSSVLPFIALLPPQLLPFSKSANRAYASADGIVAVSERYLQRALAVNDRAKSLVAYLGSEFRMVDTSPQRTGTAKLFYIGTLSYSYDIDTIIGAVHRLREAGRAVEFNIFGNGPDLQRLRNLPHVGTNFHDFLPYKQLEQQLRRQHIAVNAIRSKAPQSITNKLCDYLALGCPILNSQTGVEVTSLINSVAHRSYDAGVLPSAMQAISELVDDPATYTVWKADPRFSRDEISDSIAQFIEDI